MEGSSVLGKERTQVHGKVPGTWDGEEQRKISGTGPRYREGSRVHHCNIRYWEDPRYIAKEIDAWYEQRRTKLDVVLRH